MEDWIEATSGAAGTTASAKMARAMEKKKRRTKSPTVTPSSLAAPESHEEFWHPDDRAEIESLLQQAVAVQLLAFDQRDNELMRRVHELLSGIILVNDLLRSFRSATGGKIRGVNGVAEQLKLTRNGVYFRLEMAGLDPEDFREPSATVPALIRKSRTLAPLVDDIKGFATTIDRLRPKPR